MTGIILAAGKSKRMGLAHSKVLLPLNGRPVLFWITKLARQANLKPIIIVISPQATDIKEQIAGDDVKFVVQSEANGTADAVRVCAPFLNQSDDIFILYGDVPLLKLSTVNQLIEKFNKENADVALLTAILDDPSAYGRIERNENNEIINIVEYKDAREKTREIKEINTGVYAIRYAKLKPILETLPPNSINGEYYLTTAISKIIEQGGVITSATTETQEESFGINTPQDYEKVKKIFKSEVNQ